jgi:serine/threonine protein kinase
MDYKRLERVGKGSFGEVWKAERYDGKIIALKIMEIEGNKMKETALREVKLLKEISTPSCHPSLACFYDYKVENNTLYLEMEFIEGQTLTKFAKQYRSQGNLLPLYKHLIAIIYDVCKGLQYMHEKGIIHRDIKPDNIMIDKNNNPKLIDIGLSCSTFNKQGEQETCRVEYTSKEKVPCCVGSIGTPLYEAPETLLDSLSYFSSDIFSLGATIYTSAMGIDLFPRVMNINQLLKAVEFEEYPRLNTPNISLNVLVNNMVVKNPLKRMTATGIIDSIDN